MDRCNPHGCRPFRAAYRIKVGDKRWYVSAERAKKGLQLFLRSEWDLPRGTPAAWSQAYGKIFLRGEAIPEATITPLFQCLAEARADGWDEEGYPLEGVRPDEPLPAAAP